MPRIGDIIKANDGLQCDYRYRLSAPPGRDFDPGFTPHVSPAELLEMGVFEGKYLNDCRAEFPASWFKRARLSTAPDPTLNYFGVKSRKPLSYWREKGWIYGPDPRGWFQWYCRYWLGRRLPEVDAIQIKRWRAFSRHAAQVRKNCMPADLTCRPRQRQGLLQWAHDPFV